MRWFSNHDLILFLSTTLLAEISLGSDFPQRRNRIGISSHVGFNIKSEFKNLGGFPAQTDPGGALRGIDHFYDDGYNRIDISGNAGGRTWFWGYDSAGQVPGNDTILMNSSSAPATGALADVEEDPQLGIELSYAREIGRLKNCRWGIEGALSFVDLTFRENGTLQGDAIRTTDTFALVGTIPPNPPYRGTFQGPGPLISDTPSRTVTVLANAATTTGQWSLEAALYGARLGPYLEVPLTKRWALLLNGGLAVAVPDSEFSLNETVSIAGVATLTRAEVGSRSDVMLGGYVGGQFMFSMTEQVSLFAGAQYQNVGKFTHRVAGKQAEIDLGKAVFVHVGAALSF